MTIYENDTCFFLWKPAGIASTFGKQVSYMDLIFEKQKQDVCEQESIPTYIQKEIKNIGVDNSPVSLEKFIEHQKETFTFEQEYGLVNRLDTLTAGFLYFAKSPDIYTRRKDLQKQGRIYKHYIAGVDIFTQPGKKNAISRAITTPLAHHKNGKKMLACTYDLMNSRRKQKMKGKTLDAKTDILGYQDQPSFPNQRHRKLAHICIQKGRRHQIRCHLASEGEPIIGDALYHPDYRENDGNLQLRSIGCEVRL